MVLDDAFISPELDLQLHQSNIDFSGDYNKVLLQRSITNTDAALSNMRSDVDSATALEAMTDFIRDKKVDKTTAVLFNVATEGYGNLSSLNGSKPAFGIESIDDNGYLSEQEKQVAMENIVNSTVAVMDKLSRGLQNTMLSMGDLVHSFDRNISSIRKRISQLEQILSDIENKDDLAYNYVKPEKQFIHLLYTKTGFSTGALPVIKDINWLFKAHADMVDNTVSNYKEWFHSNRRDMDDPHNFDSLEFNPKDFVVQGSTAFNKSVGDKTPSGDNMFYRTKELPGGLSFYAEVAKQKTTGKDAVDSLMDVEYFLSYYEPDSFRMTEKQLYTLAGMTVLAWASIMLANPLPMALTGVVTNAASDMSKVSDIKKVRINEDTLFPTMTKDELSHLLVELKESLSTLEKWNVVVYKTLWKDQSLKNITDEVSQYLKTEGVQKSNVRYYRNYAVALISLMSKSYTKLHSYGFDVINATLSYAEKSARQYR